MIAGIATLALAAQAAAAIELKAPPPKLVVVCVFDQMRGDFLDRFAPAFGEGGFKRVQREGTRWVSCDYPYAATETGPGHATIATGALPYVHGIVANDWFDRALGKSVYCVEDRDVQIVGSAGMVAGLGMSPRNLVGETLGDSLRRASPASRVFAVSQKDRAAVPLGGRLASGVYWFDRPSGGYVTSTWYPDGAPRWLEEFTKARGCAAQPKAWERALPVSAYEACGDDDAPWERGKGTGLGRTFPHPLDAMPAGSERFWTGIDHSPRGMTILADLASELLDRHALGRGSATDLLLVSFSSTDFVGHEYGPDSHEVFDVYACADRELARLLAKLDAAVGAGRYVLAVTADHGVGDVPERLTSLGLEGGRIELGGGSAKRPMGSDRARIEAGLSEAFGKKLPDGERWLAWVTEGEATLDAARLKEHGVAADAAAEALRDVVARQRGIAAAYTRKQLLEGRFADNDRVARALRLSTHGSRSGDVLFALRPFWLASPNAASHGTPNLYDRRVPMLLMGPGVDRGRTVADPVSPTDLAATLAAMLRILPPPGCEGRVLPRG